MPTVVASVTGALTGKGWPSSTRILAKYLPEGDLEIVTDLTVPVKGFKPAQGIADLNLGNLMAPDVIFGNTEIKQSLLLDLALNLGNAALPAKKFLNAVSSGTKASCKQWESTSANQAVSTFFFKLGSSYDKSYLVGFVFVSWYDLMQVANAQL